MQTAIHHVVHLATASIAVQAIGRLAVARVSGIVTEAMMARIIREHLHWLPNPQLANVVDYSQCTVATTLPALIEAGRQVGAMSGANVTPTAIVASADQWPLFSGYCATAMRHGILKAVFVCADEALHWAHAEAEVRSRWLLQRTARR